MTPKQMVSQGLENLERSGAGIYVGLSPTSGLVIRWLVDGAAAGDLVVPFDADDLRSLRDAIDLALARQRQ